MKIDWTGEIDNDFYALGHPSVPVYLMDGKSPALFDAGFTGLADVYVKAIRDVLKGGSPAYLFLTHAHWDHVGSAGIFKQAWPEMRIVASRKTKEILSKPGVIDRIVMLNREALRALKEWGVSSCYEGSFEPFEVDEIWVPTKKYKIDDNATVEGFLSPGHTRDFVVYWIPERRILISSEAVGCDEVPEFLVDYDTYLKDIERFISMAPRVLCAGHKLVLTEGDVQTYLKQAWRIAEDYRCFVEECLEKGESVEEITERIRQREWDKKSFPKQPLKPYLINTKQRVQVLKERWEGKSRQENRGTGIRSCEG